MDDRRARLVVIILAVAAVMAVIGVYANRHPATMPPAPAAAPATPDIQGTG